jgi:hypothetical protein
MFENVRQNKIFKEQNGSPRTRLVLDFQRNIDKRTFLSLILLFYTLIILVLEMTLVYCVEIEPVLKFLCYDNTNLFDFQHKILYDFWFSIHNSSCHLHSNISTQA